MLSGIRSFTGCLEEAFGDQSAIRKHSGITGKPVSLVCLNLSLGDFRVIKNYALTKLRDFGV